MEHRSEKSIIKKKSCIWRCETWKTWKKNVKREKREMWKTFLEGLHYEVQNRNKPWFFRSKWSIAVWNRVKSGYHYEGCILRCETWKNVKKSWKREKIWKKLPKPRQKKAPSFDSKKNENVFFSVKAKTLWDFFHFFIKIC